MPQKLTAALLSCFLTAAAFGQDDSKAFPVRGALPWHNFLSGPTAWDETDWEQYLDRMQRLKLNLLVLHCYTGGAQRYVNYVEPMIRMEYRGVLPEAGFDTSLTARWGYRPMPVDEFAFGSSQLYRLPAGARAFGSRAALLARTNDERYVLAQALIRKVIQMAHARGIRVGMGFEFGVYPPELYSVAPPDSYFAANMLPDPTHPASMEILQLTIDDVLRAYPGLDWIWLWLQEHATPAGTGLSKGMQEFLDRDAHLFPSAGNPGTLFSGVWSLAYIRAAFAHLREKAPQVRLAVSGWGGTAQLSGILDGLDRGLPRDIVLSCLNPGLGLESQPDVLAAIAKHRETWAIPWLEGDGNLWHPQPRVALMREHVQLARRQRLNGVLAIHWRTEETRANMEAFAQFAADPEGAPSVADFYAADCRRQFGEAAGPQVAGLLARMDSEHWFDHLASPEYYPYDPGWGRLTGGLRERLAAAAGAFAQAAGGAQDQERNRLESVIAGLRFTLLLDEVSRGIEPAYRLHEQWVLGRVNRAQLEAQLPAAHSALRNCPIRELFETYAGRVRSRGALGVLSSMNQRLWQQYRDLEKFVSALKPAGSHGREPAIP